ncbi:chromate transporter [Sporosarcina sp. YIM B06819]|uniref:chromate transporter n=1 Tax=Sporosarcina sp. YIM B06819 TaxID=3081769 RepID=UPI00298BEDD5|nr:chromate transporter [Sporosarcina sp. YIM B06819]
MVLWELFSTFMVIGFVSFGGGYAMIPVIEAEVSQNGWMTTQQFIDAIAIAGMSPGPIAMNSAVLVGYSTAGVIGAILSALGILLPAIVLVIVVGAFFIKLHHYQVVQSIFYGIRPIVTSLVIYAAIRFALSNNLVSQVISWKTVSLLLIFVLSLFALLKLRWNPAYVIILSGLVGVVVYS